MLYIHIGAPKTGSSALQYFLLINREELLKNNIFYPEHEVDENNICSGNARVFFNHDVDGNSKEIQEQVTNVFHALDRGHTVLLSSESLFHTDPKKIYRLFDISDSKILVYLRRQDEYLLSLYSQRVKRRPEKNTLNVWLDDIMSKDNLAYYRAVDEWAEQFGKNRVIVRPYEKAQFFGGTIFSDFFNIIGLDLSQEYSIPRSRINRSYSPDAVEYKRVLNILTNRGDFLDRVLQKYSDSLDEHNTWPYSLLSPAKRIQILESFKERNAYLAREYLGREDGFFFEAPLPVTDEEWKPYPGLGEEKIREITDFIFKYDKRYIGIFREAVLSGLESQNSQEREAAETLVSILKYNMGLFAEIKYYLKSLIQ
ncbi:MAG: hypothetical protein JW885_15435 [Deltaproteobacteria bacterium]|nr:hypothetical protein [Candidatus Zymogenaceae bacterium]